MTVETQTAGNETALDQMDITITFELACLTLPFSELSQMGTGHVLTLPQAAGQGLVRILANGHGIGTGELVQIGDDIAVQVKELSDAG